MSHESSTCAVGMKGVLIVALGLVLGAIAAAAEARSSTASIEVEASDPNVVAGALLEVFINDGYDVTFEAEEQINFARPASRALELAYGTPLAPGSMERVYVEFFPISADRYRIECNVSIQTGTEASLADAHILPLFGRQYKKKLRRVKRAL